MPAEGQRGCCGAKASASSKKDRDSVDGLLETIGHDFVGALSAEDQCAYVWDLLNDKLQEWENFYNFNRPHGGLGGDTPYERLRQKTKSPV